MGWARGGGGGGRRAARRASGCQGIELGGELGGPVSLYEMTTDSSHARLQWRNVCLWVDTSAETRRLLDHVSGYIKPGRVCALMGASGAGKSTREFLSPYHRCQQ